MTITVEATVKNGQLKLKKRVRLAEGTAVRVTITPVTEDTADPLAGVIGIGASGRTDGAPISQSDLQIPLSALIADFDTNGDGIPDVLGLAPISVDLRVKALNPGHGQGRQNNVFSDFCHVLP